MPKNRVKQPILLGIVGDSASGKTTLSRGVAEILGEDRVAVICSDDYHRFSRQERRQRDISALNPEANYLDIMAQHLRLLKAGESVLKPVYNHQGGHLEAPVLVAPRPYIIVEGLLACLNRGVRDCFDVKVYLEPQEELRLRWKMHRDITRRGYSEAEVRESMIRRREDSATFIHPQRLYADVVIQFHHPLNQAHEERDDGHLSVRHIQRPTLPHPDLSSFVAEGAESGVYLELSRDSDGKPVDVLQIDGAISNERAESLEALLWDQIPEASHLRREGVGAFENCQSKRELSHPLALTQLLVAYYMVKAALGEHAV